MGVGGDEEEIVAIGRRWLGESEDVVCMCFACRTGHRRETNGQQETETKGCFMVCFPCSSFTL